jgi:hypothetical protein
MTASLTEAGKEQVRAAASPVLTLQLNSSAGEEVDDEAEDVGEWTGT